MTKTADHSFNGLPEDDGRDAFTASRVGLPEANVTGGFLDDLAS